MWHCRNTAIQFQRNALWKIYLSTFNEVWGCCLKKREHWGPCSYSRGTNDAAAAHWKKRILRHGHLRNWPHRLLQAKYLWKQEAAHWLVSWKNERSWLCVSVCVSLYLIMSNYLTTSALTASYLGYQALWWCTQLKWIHYWSPLSPVKM